MTKPTGRPRGRPPGRKTAPLKAKARRAALGAPVDFGLSEAQIMALGPLDVLRLVTQFALRHGDWDRAFEGARAWVQYVNPKAQPPMELTEDDIRHIAAVARAEAARRNYDLSDGAEVPEKPKPN